ncbi:MAG: thiamine pyrophosphate-dependent enzyme [Anaerolineae bacterium]
MPTFQDSDQLYRVFAALVRRLNTKPDQAEQIAGLGSVLRFYVTEPEALVTLNWTKRPLKGEMGPSKLTPSAEVWTSADALHNVFAGQMSIGDFLAQSRVEGDPSRWLDFAAWPVVVDAYTQTATRLGVIAPPPRQRATRSRRATPAATSEVVEESAEPQAEIAPPPGPEVEPIGDPQAAPILAPSSEAEATEAAETQAEAFPPQMVETPTEAETPSAAATPVEEIAAPEQKPSARGRRRRGKGKAPDEAVEAPALELPPQVVEAEAVETAPSATSATEERAEVEVEPPTAEAPPESAPESVMEHEASVAEVEPPQVVEAQSADAAQEASAPEVPPPAAKPGGKKKKQDRGRKDGKNRQAESAALPPSASAPVDAPTAPPSAPTKPGRPERGRQKEGKPQRTPPTPTVEESPVPSKAPGGNGRPVAPPPVIRPFHPEALPHTPIPLVEGEPHARHVERHDQALPVEETPLRLEMLRRMTLVRAVETRLAEELAAGALPLSDLDFSQGQEGVAVGACFALRPDDNVVTTHRSLAIFMARGSDVNGVVAEVYGKSAGVDGGKAGPASMADRRVGALASSVVGASTVLAAGWGLSARLQATDRVTLCFLGEGASNQGMFHESLNFAAVRDLPLVFVLINNGVAGATPSGETSRLENVAQRAVAYGIGSITIDGADVWAVYRSVRAAVRLARSGGGPTLIEARVSRLVADEPERYDPVVRLYNNLVEGRLLTPADAREMAAAAQLQADRAIDRAQVAPGPSPEALMSYVYSPDSAALYRRGATPPGHRTTYASAVNEALAAALTSDPTTYVIGSGLAGGGRFGTVHGLPERFGHNRVIDAPISPNVIVGSAVTAAAAGQRPIVEMGIAEFLTLAADPIVNDAAKLRYVSNGQYRVPLVIRVANGPGQGWGPHQSQSLEAWFSSIPGLLVAVPTTPYDAKGLLTAAIRSNNPVVVFESKALYPMLGQVPPDGVIVPLGVADVKRRGDDCTIVGIGAAVHEALAAAEMLAAEGVSVEVIDPRTLVPFDWTAVLDSVVRTGRLVVAEETTPVLGWSAEIAAQVSRHLHGHLRAPVERVSAAAVPLPYSPSLARLALAGADNIAEAVRRAM